MEWILPRCRRMPEQRAKRIERCHCNDKCAGVPCEIWHRIAWCSCRHLWLRACGEGMLPRCHRCVGKKYLDVRCIYILDAARRNLSIVSAASAKNYLRLS